jgi:predicted glycogen debranching enzyme
MSEWLEADGFGGFASGTICGIRTRRYHALLLAATKPPAERMVLVNGFDASLSLGAASYALSTQCYSPGVDWPDGTERLESFEPEPWPQWTYGVAGGRVVQEIFVPKDYCAVVLRWRWEGPQDETLRLRIRPFFSGRDFHATHHENSAFRFAPESLPYGERWQFYDGLPKVAARSNGIYSHAPDWYRNFQYDEELARGLDGEEDLATPGWYDFNLAAGPSVLIFSTEGLGLPFTNPSMSAVQLATSLANAEKTRRESFATPRLRAGDAYIVHRPPGKTIIAGYPWFGDWGRDTFIAMRGLCLATGRLFEARDILLAWAGTESEGMLPNRFPDHGDQPEYNSVDASLWYIIVVHEFLQLASNNPALTGGKDKLFATVDAILTGYANGTRYGIRADADGLLACGVTGVQLTWMDAKVGDWVVTPRIGKPVEIQSLWLNALSLAGGRNPKWRDLFEKGRAAFEQRFWNEARHCLFDVVDADHEAGKNDASLRPNQIFAVGGLPLALLTGDRAARVVQVVHDQLWTPLGPRSLAPNEMGYARYYQGDQRQRDGAYHQGTVWPWLAGPFVEAWLRVNDNTPESKAQAVELFLTPQLSRLDLHGLNHVPEIADGDAPHAAKGCPFQAWSVGEQLRLGKILGIAG